MRYFFIVLFCIICYSVSAQKKAIDHTVYGMWQRLDYEVKLSDDGKVVIYSFSSEKLRSNLVIKKTDNTWSEEIPNATSRDACFVDDYKSIVYRTFQDSLIIFNLRTLKKTYFADIKSFKVAESASSPWVSFCNGRNELVLYNASNHRRESISCVTDYLFDKHGQQLLVKARRNDSKEGKLSLLSLINLRTFVSDTILVSQNDLANFVFDSASKQLLFTEEAGNINLLRYYANGMDSATTLVNDETKGVREGLIVSKWGRNNQFSKDGSTVYFYLSKSSPNENIAGGSKQTPVDVWHYKDLHLQSEQLARLAINEARNFLAVIHIETDSVVQLETQEDDPSSIQLANCKNREYILLATKGNRMERYWNKDARPSIYLVSTSDGKRDLIAQGVKAVELIRVSASGKYVIYFDRELHHFFTYNIESGAIANISKNIPFPLYREDFSQPDFPYPYGTAGWLVNDSAVLIYDRYDIWQVDPNGVKTPVNITHGFGRSHKIVLRYVDLSGKMSTSNLIHPKQKMLLSTFNLNSKESGFSLLSLGINKITAPRSLGAFKYEVISKSVKSNGIIVKRESSYEAPNLYFTRDFKHFSPLSNYQPQKNYNWFKAELVRFPISDSVFAEGKLYKPENFDPLKKYPIIFTFYEIGSDAVNWFIYPEPSNGGLNIPYFVSNGYLVFEPNISFKTGELGESIYRTIFSAIQYLGSRSWIDSTKMGLCGISFTGYQINYLVTRTTKFAAAAPAAGPVNLVSLYNGLRDQGISAQWVTEISQLRMGHTLWENPSSYIQNSPIYFADRVQTPLLIMHNKEDDAVSWSQGVEWFTALRRLGKKVWMLQYDGEPHGLYNMQNRIDYSIRLAQFFDYYLKDALPPKWMIDGVPASEKGLKTVLELDNSGRQP